MSICDNIITCGELVPIQGVTPLANGLESITITNENEVYVNGRYWGLAIGEVIKANGLRYVDVRKNGNTFTIEF